MPVFDTPEPISVTVDPSGKLAYVANFGSANVSAYTINATTGMLSAVAGSPFAAGTKPTFPRATTAVGSSVASHPD